DEVYNRLSKLGFEVLFDDRYESAGVKFNDADLLGFPVRLVVSPRTLKETAVEVKGRREKKGHLATLDQLPQAIQQYLNPVEEVPHGRDLAR
ncbi:MAG: hypothetical protein HYU29_02400, partial [Chloroflexi bacterium]|nr:hypothetical protein [Chloroflexota bacterium]